MIVATPQNARLRMEDTDMGFAGCAAQRRLLASRIPVTQDEPVTAPVQAHSLDIDPAVVPGVWERWVDVSTWPEDDPDTKAATLEAAPAVGVRGRVVPKGGPSSTIVITRCDPLQAFYLRTPLPLATMSFEHDLETLDTGMVRMTHRLVFSGPMRGVFRRLIGTRIAAGFPQVMQSIVTHAGQAPAQ